MLNILNNKYEIDSQIQEEIKEREREGEREKRKQLSKKISFFWLVKNIKKTITNK